MTVVASLKCHTRAKIRMFAEVERLSNQILPIKHVNTAKTILYLLLKVMKMR